MITVSLLLRYPNFIQGMDTDGQMSTAIRSGKEWCFTSYLHGDAKPQVGKLNCSYEKAINHVLVHLGQRAPQG